MSQFLDAMLDRDLSRRAFLRSAGRATGLLSLPFLLQCQTLAAVNPTAGQRSLILLWQDGGPSHFETFDPKPDAPSEFRGDLEAISTSLPGVAYSEVLPRLARLAHRTCVVRSLHQPSSDHVVGSHNVLTGWYDQTEGSKSRYPDLGAVISRMRSGTEVAEVAIGVSTDPRLAKGMRGPSSPAVVRSDATDLPRYIDISSGLHRGGPAFLGPVNGPFQIAGDPSKPGFVIQNLNSVGDAERFYSREKLLAGLEMQRVTHESFVAGFEQHLAIDRFRQQAAGLLSGGAAASAFDLSRERPEDRDRYGRHVAGQQCLLARRLVEAGVGVVAVRFSPDGRGDYDRTMIGWDDHAVHGNIFEIMRVRGPQFDQAVSALIEDLDQRGLTDQVLLVVVGEFGRTPRIHVHKGCPGREHWGPAGCALLYGGGLVMGQVVGSTNAKGEQPDERPVSYQSLLSTIYYALGINPTRTFLNPSGRPVPILPEGDPVGELIGDSRGTRPGNKRLGVLKIPLLDPLRPVAHLGPGIGNAHLNGMKDRASLQSLTLHDSRVNDQGMAAIADCRSLIRLELNGSPITDAGLVHLSQLTVLEELSLTGTRTTDAGLLHLKPLARLRRLEFNGTAISLAGVVRLFVDEQARSVLDALNAMGLVACDEHGQVVAINVAGTLFGDDELRQIGALPSLRELHLAATRVTDRGMAYVARLTNLERLYLAKCDITDTGLSHLAGLTRLQAINLYGTKLTDTGLAHFYRLERLRSLMITDVKLSAAAVEQLKAKLPRLTVTDFTAV